MENMVPEERDEIQFGLDDDEEFNPLAVDDLEINQEDMDDDNPYDTIDYPTMRNMPEHAQRGAVYTPERMGSAEAALADLLDHNPARRPVLMAILHACDGGKKSSEVTDLVESLQADNRSVYEPMTFCRMLERAGALRLEMPQIAEEREDVEAGVEYLEIKERIDPIWHATEAGLEAYNHYIQGKEFSEIVLDRDSRYIEVYAAIMEALDEAPRTKQFLEELTDTFPVVMKPRRFAGHFIDMLERTDAIEWKNRAWQLSDLGRSMLPDVRKAAEEHARTASANSLEWLLRGNN